VAFAIPTLEDIAQRARSAFQTYLPGVDATVWPSNIAVSAKVIAGRVWEVFHRLDFVAKQSFPLTATGFYLERHAQAYGISRNTQVKSSGSIILTGGTHTTKIPTGTQFQAADGSTYSSTSDVYIASDGTATVPVTADTPGPDSQVAGGAAMTMLATITGAPTSGVAATTGISGGADVESDSSLRARLLDRLRTPPQAGSVSDYIRWAKTVPGVTRVWVAGNAQGPGTVGVYFSMDDIYSNGVPTAADAATVQAYIDTVAPITAKVTVSAPVADPIHIEVSGLTPFTSAVADAVKAELKAMIQEKAEVSTASETKYIRRSWVWQAVSNATGERYHTVVIPQEDYPIPVGKIATYSESSITLGG